MAEVEYQSKTYYFQERDEEKYPVRRAENITPDKIYRTRSGDRVRIYSVEGRELHGAIFRNETWHIDTWDLGGKYLNTGKEHDRDIVLSKPLQITPGTKYKSRDGRPIKIFEVNLNSKEYPVIGVIKEEKSNEWVPRVWNFHGLTKVPYGANNDIVAEWSEV